MLAMVDIAVVATGTQPKKLTQQRYKILQVVPRPSALWHGQESSNFFEEIRVTQSRIA